MCNCMTNLPSTTVQKLLSTEVIVMRSVTYHSHTQNYALSQVEKIYLRPVSERYTNRINFFAHHLKKNSKYTHLQ